MNQQFPEGRLPNRPAQAIPQPSKDGKKAIGPASAGALKKTKK